MNRLVWVAAILSLIGSTRASAVVLTSSWPIIGGSIPVTLTLTDVAAGNAVEITVSIPEGEGDILGLFGNLVNESLAPQLDAVGSIVTQEQYAANQVYKVGGGNEMTPVTGWDWGLRFESYNWQTENIHTVTFQLTAPGLTVAQLVNAANQGWYFGVRVQHMLGPKSKGSIGFPVTPPPPGTPPTIAIAAPAEGALLAQSSVVVSGPITGTPPLSVSVNGLSSPLTNGSTAFARTMTLADGTQIVRAAIGNSYGYMIDEISVTVDTTPPVVSITAPSDGSLTTSVTIPVSGTVTDATSGVASVVVNGVTASLTGSAFSAVVPVTLGQNQIGATATDLAGNASQPAVVSVTRGIPPTIAISTPTAGFTTGQPDVLVTGSVGGTEPVTILVNGVPATASGGVYSTAVPLALGPNTIRATAANAFGSAFAEVSGQRTASSIPLGITIQSPPNGAVTSARFIPVSGIVSDGSAAVTVNGSPAIISGDQYVVPVVELVEGNNTLAAQATRGAEMADAQVSVTYNAPPSIVITSPSDGATLRVATVDVEGVVDDLTAFVDVNGVVATVGAGGRFLAHGVPLSPGENPLLARAIDPLGAIGADRIVVTRDDAAAPPLRLVFTSLARYPFFVTSETVPEPVIAENAAEFGEALAPLGFPAEEFSPAIERIEATTGDHVAFVFAESDGDVSYYENGDLIDGPIPMTPIEALPDDFLFVFADLDLDVIPRLLPSDVDARFYATIDLSITSDGSGPQGVADIEVVSTDGGIASLAIEAETDTPVISILSPLDGSIVSGGSITVTGAASDDGRLFERVRYEILDDTFAVVDQGVSPLVGGRFTIPEIPLASGPHCVVVTAFDAAGNREGSLTCVTIDASAPIVQLVSPRDGEGVLASSVSIDLNFAVAGTILSVNGVPDGRTFGVGLARDALILPLVPGANTISLVVDSGSGPASFSFTLFRVTSIDPISIVDPREGASLNSASVPITVKAPIGTTAVRINGTLATPAADRVSHVANVPIASGENPITAIAYPFGQVATTRILGDFRPPRFLGGIPGDGAVTPQGETFLVGFYDEAAEITIESPSGSIATTTRFDQARSNQLFGLAVYRFEAPSLALALGDNVITIRARDAAGNESVHHLTVERQGGALLLSSPADGSSTPNRRVTISLEALADITIDAWYSGSMRVPAFEGVEISTGISTFADVPLQPGQTELRVVYRRPGGAPEILSFGLASTADDFASVTGTVTDARSGQGLGGALVMITASGASVIAVTAQDGTYSAQVGPGDAVIRVSREGFLEETLGATLASGATTIVDASPLPWSTTTQPISDAPSGTLASSIAGVVGNGQTGSPIPGAVVAIVNGGASFTATSGADGSYSLDGLPSGQFTVTISAAGYATRSFAVPLESAVLLTLDVPLQAGTGGGGDLTTTVAGTVTDADGQPIEGVEITASIVGTPVAASTDPHGRYRLDGIPPGSFSVVVVRAGYFPQVWDIPYASAVLVPLNPVLARLATTTTLTGTVRSDITGLLEGGVKVELLGSGIQATTDPSGRFTIDGVPVQVELTLRLAKPGFLEEFSWFTASARPEGYPFEMELRYPLFESSDATLAIGPDASGIVADALSGRPLAGALVEAGPISAVADSEGRFTLHGLSRGSTVEVTASASDYDSQKVVAVVVTGGSDPLDFALGAQRLGEIQGVVTDSETGLPVYEAEVRINGSETLVTSTNPDGSYRLLAVPAGSHDVSIRSPEHFPLPFVNVAVAQGGTATLDGAIAPRPRTGGLVGHVLDESTGLPVAGANLTVTGGFEATSATDGSYEFPGLPAGLAQLTIVAPGYPTSVRAAPVLADVDASTPTVTTQDVRLAPSPADPSAMTAVIVASEGGYVETPDGRARLDIPPGSLTGDGEITIRRSPDPEVEPGQALQTELDLNLPTVTAISDQVEILVGAPAGGAKPYLVGPVFLSARFYEDESLAAGAAERSAFPYLFDGTQWTALEMVPYLHAVDRLNNLVVVGLVFGESMTGRDVIAQRTTLHPVRLAQIGGGGFPPEDLILDAYRFVVGAVDSIVPDGRVGVIDLLGVDSFNSQRSEPPFFAINTYSRPVLVAHGWDPWNILVNSELYNTQRLRADDRYATILDDLIASTNAIYRPIFLTYNSRQSLGANGQAFAEKIQAMYPDGTEEEPLFPDPFRYPLDAFQNPKIFGTFDSFGFSMGGLLNRAYQRASFYYDSAPELPGEEERRGRINRMVSMGTPHHGALQAIRAIGAGLALGTRFPIESLLAIWSPGTAQLLDYIDSPNVPCAVSGNPFICQMNRDSRSGPNSEISLIAGTKSVFEWGGVLFEAGLAVVPTAVSDGVVPLSSAHGESTLSRRLASALRHRRKFQQAFDHQNAGKDAAARGEGDQRIRSHVDEDILPILQDHWVVRRRTLDEERVPVIARCPTAEEDGWIDVNIAFDYKADNEGLTGISMVTYAEDSEGDWHIIQGADPSSGELDSRFVLTAQGNSREVPNPDEELVIQFRRPIESGTDARRLLILPIATGRSSPTEGRAPQELTDAFVQQVENAERITSCGN